MAPTANPNTKDSRKEFQNLKKIVEQIRTRRSEMGINSKK
ncbi:hypothetical protein C5167_024054 [Papaver somniferum]|uniref:Uncharacterized protein n=1 Tax=Papaver somniferum TaxID=3469 RepID=A0A4Y7JQL9_PAPSO|nr:hypothetical protein C5167_024054 [Papaver somniferum]